jgi:hypothetical protein
MVRSALPPDQAPFSPKDSVMFRGRLQGGGVPVGLAEGVRRARTGVKQDPRSLIGIARFQPISDIRKAPTSHDPIV